MTEPETWKLRGVRRQKASIEHVLDDGQVEVATSFRGLDSLYQTNSGSDTTPNTTALTNAKTIFCLPLVGLFSPETLYPPNLNQPNTSTSSKQCRRDGAERREPLQRRMPTQQHQKTT